MPVASRSSMDMHNLKISYDRSGKSVSWHVEGRKVFKVTRPGHFLPNHDFVVIDRGGTERDAVGESMQHPSSPYRKYLEAGLEPMSKPVDHPALLHQLVCGIGMFTLLDAYNREAKQALVRLVGSPSAYYRSPANASTPAKFFDETSERSNRLFGQGATLRVRNVVISNQPTALSEAKTTRSSDEDGGSDGWPVCSDDGAKANPQDARLYG
ncbi:hypothetical protein EHS25_007267 [Saitozyma podzolica]|uniref:Uncharacterized protein n=1 Tax=Saitozyma podzolica TaxID=1890683 RepID=A0A427XN32_9TREE|nr:hypothetical protein EHS25_007267 [Saitozyma podzolica]